jgi:CBS domain-containing protein
MDNNNFSRTINSGQSESNLALLQRNMPGKAKDIMKCGVITVRVGQSVYEAIKIMVEKSISGLPVINDRGLVGIISEKDILTSLYNTEFLQGGVEDYMTKEVVGFDVEDSLSDICDCLINNHFRRVPIFNQGRLAGIISRADIIKASVHRFKSQQPAGESDVHKDIPIASDIMTCGLLTVKGQSPISEAMELAVTHNISSLPVVDDYMNLVGIISEMDMLKLLYNPQNEPGNIEDFMTKQVVSFNHDDSLFDICDCFIDNNFRSIPILNQGRLVGIISRADIMVYILKNKSDILKHSSVCP